MSRIRKIVSQRLRALRKDMTQEALARKAGVSVYVVGKIERQETTPSLETLYRLCRAMGVSLGEFFTTAQSGQDTQETAEALRVYLLTKRPEDVQFADQMVRQMLERLEGKS